MIKSVHMFAAAIGVVVVILAAGMFMCAFLAFLAAQFLYEREFTLTFCTAILGVVAAYELGLILRIAVIKLRSAGDRK